jgi:tRNA threonylcarbamoyladenosine biosynthesis protein TsaE
MAGSSERVTETAGPDETQAAGAALAGRLVPGDVVVVSGELGAGKTTLVRGAARALGVTDPVVSPTFTIGRRYSGRVPVSHVDLYRLEGLEAEDPALLADYLSPDAVAFVEWPERAGQELARVAARVRLEHLGGDRRRITVS